MEADCAENVQLLLFFEKNLNGFLEAILNFSVFLEVTCLSGQWKPHREKQ